MQPYNGTRYAVPLEDAIERGLSGSIIMDGEIGIDDYNLKFMGVYVDFFIPNDEENTELPAGEPFILINHSDLYQPTEMMKELGSLVIKDSYSGYA